VDRFRPKITPVATTVYREKEIALTAIVFTTMNALAWPVLVAAMGRTMEEMENMPGMQHSHLIMVYVGDRDGNAVENAWVGYLIKGPGTGVQKTMCMGMGCGYGAHVTLEDAGQSSEMPHESSESLKLFELIYVLGKPLYSYRVIS
jgi:hypothetical protein